MFKEINIGGYVLRFYPTDNKGWMCGITDEQLTALMSITTLFTNPVKELTDKDIDIALYVADITLDNLSDGDISMERIKAFVRTILRKAQEK